MRSCVSSVPGLLGVWALLSIGAAAEAAQKPSAEAALKLAPVQRDVEIDQPDAETAARCTIEARQLGKHVGWVIEDPNGVELRRFLDTNGDNVVDQWCYFKDGLEVYRDIDANFNGKADQYRWFHTAGTRWAVDRDEDGRIDSWKSISAEEVTAEVVAALAARDVDRFARVVLTASELKQLGLGPERTKQLAAKIKDLEGRFRQLVSGQAGVPAGAEWIQFSGNQPGIVPAGTDGSTRDLRVYENVVAIYRRGDSDGQVQIGTLVQVGDVWRVIDLPQPIAQGQHEMTVAGFFFQGPTASPQAAGAIQPDSRFQDLLAELEKLDKAIAQAGSLAQRARLNRQRADLYEQIAQAASSSEDRALWIRQLADTVSAEAQSEGYPEGPQRLTELYEKLRKDRQQRQLAAYVLFRQMTAEYALKMRSAKATDFPKIQEEWLKGLEQYIKTYPDCPDTAEAMLQLAMGREFGGEDDQAKEWYGKIVNQFPKSSAAVKARGALTRLDSVGKTIQLRGRTVDGRLVDLAELRGRPVIVHYWATWSTPSTTDMVALKELLRKYGNAKLSIIGINLDSTPSEVQRFLAEHQFPWPQIYEEGGLDSRLANEMGILTVPTMILIDRSGKVVNRNVHLAELEGELGRILK
ncbi:MAG TPA: redoxin domain-containing protein [Planctomycetes bacterium]|nr:redoxin domain-containing protein [Planctomycetota bacterium]